MSEAHPRGHALRQLGSILVPWRRLLGLVGALILASALLELVPPLLMRGIVDDHLIAGRADGLVVLALVYLGAVVAIHATSALATYFTAVAAQGALHALRVRLFSHFQALPVSYFDRNPLGDVISRCTADVETIETVFTSGVAKAVADVARLATVSIAMVALSPPLAAVSVLVAPPVVLITRLLQVRLRAAERAHRQAYGLLNTRLQETLGGVEVVRAFGREAEFVAQFRVALRELLRAYNSATFFAALYPPVMGVLASLCIAGLLWVGAGGALADWNISLGTLTAFVLLFTRFFKPITALGDEWQTIQSALSGAERIFEVLALPMDGGPRTEDGGRTTNNGRRTTDDGRWTKEVVLGPRSSVLRPSPAIELRGVTFGYLEGSPVLRDVSLAVRPGEHVALVGRTGAGKTSILSLAGGLYAPWSGEVRILGRDPRALEPEERQRLIGVVPQMVQLFAGTVVENLTLFDLDPPRDLVTHAATVAGASAIVGGLPLGYDTPLSGVGRGEGVQLSAGQRQLLALARALVRDPAVLLLDEATAAIDSASDAAFRASLRASASERGCAVLTIAHRLSTAREADRVIVLEAGRIVEEGPPAMLERRGGRFAALLELEAAGWAWDSE